MSDIEQAVEEMVAAALPLLLLIGDPPRIHHKRLPQNAPLPAVVYQLVSDPSVNSHDGPSGLARARVQFDCWGRNKSEMWDVARALRISLPGIRGTFGGMAIHGGLKLSEQTDASPDLTGSMRRRIIDVAFWHEEEVPAS